MLVRVLVSSLVPHGFDDSGWQTHYVYIVSPGPVKVKRALANHFSSTEVEDFHIEEPAMRGPWAWPESPFATIIDADGQSID